MIGELDARPAAGVGANQSFIDDQNNLAHVHATERDIHRMQNGGAASVVAMLDSKNGTGGEANWSSEDMAGSVQGKGTASMCAAFPTFPARRPYWFRSVEAKFDWRFCN